MVRWGAFLGRVAAYLLVDGAIAAYLFTLHYQLFDLPIFGRWGPLSLLLLSYLLAVVLLGFLLRQFFRRREDALLLVLWSSIPLLMMSGLSLPREAMPEWLYALGNLLPSSPAIRGVIKIHSMGAALSDVWPELIHLLMLALFYGFLLRFAVRKSCRGV